MPDEERPFTIPPKVMRIAVIGSSEAAAEQVQRSKTFEAVMEHEINDTLEARYGIRTEVLNFGVAGYNLTQEYLTLRDHVWKYAPKMVILATTSMALVRSDRKLFPEHVPGTPFYEVSNGDLVPDRETSNYRGPDPRRQALKNWFADVSNRSQMLLALNKAATNIPVVLTMLRQDFAFRKNGKAALRGKQLPITDGLYNPDNPALRKAWGIEDAFVRAMKQECDRHGAEFTMIVLPREREEDPDSKRAQKYAEDAGVSSLFLTDERMAERARADGVNAAIVGTGTRQLCKEEPHCAPWLFQYELQFRALERYRQRRSWARHKP